MFGGYPHFGNLPIWRHYHACYVQHWLMYCASEGHRKLTKHNALLEVSTETFGFTAKGLDFLSFSYLRIFTTHSAMVETTT